MFVNPRLKPLLIYDGRCGFCRKWVGRWRAITGDRVEYAPSQEVAANFPQIPEAEFRRSVQLIDMDGRVLSGAEAAFRAVAYAPRRGACYWAYQHVPGFATLSEALYRLVARHRTMFGAMTSFLWGASVEPPTYTLTRRIFLRMLGVIYLIAFLSLGVQIRGLVGQKGILPIAQQLDAIGAYYEHRQEPAQAYWRFPTLAWWKSSDVFLQGVLCGGGALLSVLLILGIAPMPVLVLLWAFYLSLYVAGQIFTSFQWDILLLEAGFLSIFYAPMSLRLGSPRALPPSRTVLFLLRWLLIRLMFLSGLVKLTYGDSVWQDLTALRYHYETQPLPTWTSWYIHHMPLWFHQASIALAFAIELIAPFLMFGPRRLRYWACGATVLLMALIGVTGNYTFFNLLTAVLCINLLDDQFFGKMLTRRKRERLARLPRPNPALGTFRWLIVAPVAAAIFVISVAKMIPEFTPRAADPQWYAPLVDRLGPWREKYKWVLAKAGPFHLVNNYGLFRVMTTERPEIVIEGSNDLQTWQEYQFRWKPGDVYRAPAFVEPHQPRLDWQMWFAALSPRHHQRWVAAMMTRMLEGSDEVLNFFSYNPFADEPPKYIRALMYDYRFSDPQTLARTGAWWQRELRGAYIPPLVKPSNTAPPVDNQAAATR
jgi:predicted DCC family thiol-disulfide oxidoreductase YuxK